MVNCPFWRLSTKTGMESWNVKVGEGESVG
jgi:hypothetical protein